MRRYGTIAISLPCLFCVLLFTAAASAQDTAQDQSTSALREQINDHEQKLADARATLQLRDQVVEFNTLCSLYRQEGDTQKGLDDCNQALAMERAAGNRSAEALTENVIGRIYTDLGQEKKALDLFNQILPVWRETGSRLGEASTLNNIGRAYSDLGQKQKALDFYNQALPIWREVRNRDGEANTLDNIGRAYCDLGQARKGLDFLNQALPIWRETGERGGEALTTNNLGRAYADMGEKKEALESYNRALAMWREVGNRQGEALTLDNLGRVYSDLGQKQQALDDFNRALPLYRQVGSRAGEALALNDIGRVYSDRKDAHKALDYYSRALAAWRAAGNRRGEAQTLGNIGRSYLDLGQKSKALQLSYQSLSAWREVGDARGEAFALSGVGRVYASLGRHDRALPPALAGLSLATTAGDPNIQGGIDSSLMYEFRDQRRPEEAIFFGTEAVNAYQQIRSNLSGLDQDLQSGFVQSKSATYRELAELLVQAGRLAEAEHVLDLLKEEELKEVVRGADAAQSKLEPLSLSDAQQKAQGDLATTEETAATLTDLSLEYAALEAKTARTPEETARLKELETKIEAVNGQVSEFFRKTLYPELAQSAGTQNANALVSAEKSDVSQLQNTLAALGPRVMGIRLLLGEQHAYAIVVTAQARKKFEIKATPPELRSKVLQVRDDLRNPSSDPKAHLAELYAMVVAPFATELKALERNAPEQGRVPTLLWSLDGVMRYLPMPALYDGQHYLVERFANILFTPESYGHMTASSASDQDGLRVLAMGLSKSYGGLPALPGVLPELDAVVHDPSAPESHGPMAGVLLPNERFTYAALKTELGAGSGFPVVHIASHFVLATGGGQEPYLMLGGDDAGEPDGYQLTLSKLEDSPVSFHGTHLLTLSACSTASGDVAADGLEMDSLGMIAQQKDAEAVMATLWDVNDASTSRIMSDFYARWVASPATGKAEALRQAQLAFLHGTRSSGLAGNDRGVRKAEPAGAAANSGSYAHPFYWAPFVLIGNYR